MRIADIVTELAKRKKEEGWTCQDMGLRCGLSVNTIQRWLGGGGQGGLRVSTLSSLARGMGYVFRLAGRGREASGPMRLTEVAGALDAIRKERRLVAADLVRKGGPTTNIVRDLLNGRRDGMVATLAGVAAALGQEIEMARKG